MIEGYHGPRYVFFLFLCIIIDLSTSIQQHNGEGEYYGSQQCNMLFGPRWSMGQEKNEPGLEKTQPGPYLDLLVATSYL